MAAVVAVAAYIQTLTRLSTRDQERLAAYYGGLPATIRAWAHDRQRHIITSWLNNKRAGHPGLLSLDTARPGENGYAALLVALSELRAAERAIAKGRNLDERTVKLCDIVRRERAGDRDKRPKTSPKADLVRRNIQLVIDLRAEGKPWPEIAKHPVFFKKLTSARIQQVYRDEMCRIELARIASVPTSPKAEDA